MNLDCDVFPVLSLFSEVDLFHNWMSIIKDSTILGEPSPFRKCFHYNFNFPWPLSSRDAVLIATGIPIPQNKSAMLVIRSMNDSYLGVDVPTLDSKTVRIDIQIGGMNIMMKGPNKTQLSLIMQSDPHIRFIPQKLINFCCKHTLYYFMDSIK